MFKYYRIDLDKYLMQAHICKSSIGNSGNRIMQVRDDEVVSNRSGRSNQVKNQSMDILVEVVN